MKRTTILILVASMLFATLISLSSCTRRGVYEEVLESQKEAESKDSIPEVSDNISGESAADYRTPVILKTGNTPFYEGKTFEDLLNIGKSNGQKEGGTQMTTTGLLYYNSQMTKLYFYNKLTGNFSNWCADPLCDGENCLWSNSYMAIQYISDDSIYFLANASQLEDKYGIYRCDLQRNNIEKILDIAAYRTYFPDENGDGRPDGSEMSMDGVEVICEKDNIVYYLHITYAEEIKGSKGSLYTLDLNTKEKRIISGKLDLELAFIINDMVYYTTSNEPSNLYRADMQFSSPELVRENTYLWTYNDKYIILGDRLSTHKYIYNIRTGQTHPMDVPVSKGNLVISGDYVYYSRKLTKTEIDNDPLKDYYTYTWEEPSHFPGRPSKPKESDTQDAGRIYRKFLGEENSKEECVFQLTYKNIPVRLKTLEIDGEVLYISFHNYEGFTNFYNQDFSGDEYGAVCYAVVDFQNGTVDLLKLPKED